LCFVADADNENEEGETKLVSSSSSRLEWSEAEWRPTPYLNWGVREHAQPLSYRREIVVFISSTRFREVNKNGLGFKRGRPPLHECRHRTLGPSDVKSVRPIVTPNDAALCNLRT